MIKQLTELGKHSNYDQTYNPDRLVAIPRAQKRKEMDIDCNNLPFTGYDYWNHYEVSWLNQRGKPQIGIAEIKYTCTSPNIIESKSLKLYFNSFNNTHFNSANELINTVQQDLQTIVQAPVNVQFRPFSEHILQPRFSGACIDDLDIECSIYTVRPEFLTTGQEIVTETLYSDLLKSNCLVTNQPDWGSVQISYRGNKLDRCGLLRYIVSFRNHNEFHEQCIERIFIDILNHCKPTELAVYGCYTRRGGLDINPLRKTPNSIFEAHNTRLIRQ